MRARAGKPKKKSIRRLEQELQKNVVRTLRLLFTRETVVIHVPNGGYRSPVEAAILVGMGVMAGFPDLIILHDGRAYLIEMKIDSTNLSDDQRDAWAALAPTNVPMAVCRSLDEVIAWIVVWKIPTRMKEAA